MEKHMHIAIVMCQYFSNVALFWMEMQLLCDCNIAQQQEQGQSFAFLKGEKWQTKESQSSRSIPTL